MADNYLHITKSLMYNKPKYWPLKESSVWYVRDNREPVGSKIKFGPSSMRACHKFIDRYKEIIKSYTDIVSMEGIYYGTE